MAGPILYSRKKKKKKCVIFVLLRKPRSNKLFCLSVSVSVWWERINKDDGQGSDVPLGGGTVDAL